MFTTPSTRRPRCTPTSTLSAPPFIAQPTISFPSDPATRGAGSPMPRSSRSASPRRSWASRAFGASSPSPESGSGISSPSCWAQPGFHKRRRRLSDTIEWLIGIFASASPGAEDSVVLLDSTPVECGRSRETAKRSAPGDAAAYGYCRSHERAARTPELVVERDCRRPGRAACRDPHAQVRERARAQAHAPEEARVANVA